MIDRDKVAELGLNLQTVGQDLARRGGRELRQPLQHRRPQLQGHPAAPAGRAAQPRAAQGRSTSPGRTDSSSRSSSIASSRDTVTPRSLNRFQQLNAVKISGVAVRPLDEALGFLEGEAAQDPAAAATSIDYTGESRQLRTEGNKFLPAFLLAVVLIFLVLAAQFNSFRDPFVILAGSVPLACSAR